MQLECLADLVACECVRCVSLKNNSRRRVVMLHRRPMTSWRLSGPSQTLIRFCLLLTHWFWINNGGTRLRRHNVEPSRFRLDYISWSALRGAVPLPKTLQKMKVAAVCGAAAGRFKLLARQITADSNNKANSILQLKHLFYFFWSTWLSLIQHSKKLPTGISCNHILERCFLWKNIFLLLHRRLLACYVYVLMSSPHTITTVNALVQNCPAQMEKPITSSALHSFPACRRSRFASDLKHPVRVSIATPAAPPTPSRSARTHAGYQISYNYS